VKGALIAEPPRGKGFAVADPATPCASAKPRAISCTDVNGPGGRFLVIVEPDPADKSKVIAQIYDDNHGEDPNPRAEPVQSSAPTTVGPPGNPGEYFEITLGAADLGDKLTDIGVAVVTFVPSAASAPAPQIDLVTWDAGAAAPSVVHHIDGGRGADLRIDAGTIIVTEPDYSDGSPGCCPKTQAIHSIKRDASGKWTTQTRTQPISADKRDFSPLKTKDPVKVAAEVWDAWKHHDRYRAARGATDAAVKAMFEDGYPNVDTPPQCQKSGAGWTCSFQGEGTAFVLHLATTAGALRVTRIEYLAD